MKYLRHYLILVALLLSAPVYATSFSQLVVFGDSLSDTGNIFSATFGITPLSPYSAGRFSNGPVWVERLSENLGLGPVVASRTGGTNYAYGGARTNEDVPLPAPFTGSIPSLTNQTAEYLLSTAGVADPSALYIVWGGGNNVLNNAGVPGSGQDIAGIVESLAAAGATNFLVPNLPDIGLTPGATSGGTSAAATALTDSHNAELAAALSLVAAANPSLNIILFDVYSIFNDLIMFPESFGFSNTAEACWDGDTFGNGVQCADPDQYVFWDGVHPTAAAHALLGDIAFESLSAPVPIPAAVWLFAPALLGLMGLRRKA